VKVNIETLAAAIVKNEKTVSWSSFADWICWISSLSVPWAICLCRQKAVRVMFAMPLPFLSG